MRFSKTAALLTAALLVTMGVGAAFAGTAQHDDHADANATADHGPAENASAQAHAIHAVIEQYLSGELDADSLGAAVSDVAASDSAAENESDDDAAANESDDRDDAAENESAANESAQEPPEQAEDDEADEERTDDGDERDEAEEDRAEAETDDQQPDS